MVSAFTDKVRTQAQRPRGLALPFILNSGASLLVLLAGLSVSFLAARYLGPAGFGILGLVQWTRVTCAMLLDIGVSSATTKFTSELIADHRHKSVVEVGRAFFWIQSGVGVVSAIGLVVLAPLIANLLGQPDLVIYLPIAAVTVGLMLINGVLAARLVGSRRFGLKAVLDGSSAVLSLVGVVAVLSRDWGIGGLVWTEAAVAAVQFVAQCWISREVVLSVPGIKIPASMQKRIRRYALGVFMVTAFDAVIWQRSEVLFIALFRGADEIGYFTIAYGFAVTVTTLLPHSLGVVLFPSLSERQGLKDRTGLQHLYRTSTRHIAFMTFPLCVGGVVLAPDIIIVLYGSQFEPAASALRVLFLGAAVGALATPGSGLFLAVDRAGTRSALAVPIIAVNLVLAVVLVPMFGAVGAAAAKSLTQLIHVSVDASYLAMRERFALDWSGLGRIAMASLAPGLVAFVLSSFMHGVLGLAIEVLAGGLAYVVALIILRAVPEDDLKQIASATRTGWLASSGGLRTGRP